MNFLFSIFILILLILLTIIYVSFLWVSIKVILILIKKYKGAYKTDSYFGKENIRRQLLQLFRIALIITVIFLGVYIKQRIQWIDKDSANRQAKEFWVTGQTIASVRFAALRLFHPENPLFYPYLALQKITYQKGVELIPDDDGEKYIWLDNWFLYPYSRRELLPYGVNIKDPSDKMVYLLDDCWEALEGMATKPIADKQMWETFYLRNYPSLSSYYVSFDGFYMGRYLASQNSLLNTPKYSERLAKLLAWLKDLESEWYNTGVRQNIIKKIPVVDSVRGVTKAKILTSLVKKQLILGEFDCSSTYLHELYKDFCLIMDPNHKDNFLQNFSKTSRSQARYLYRDLLYSFQGSLSRYLMTEVCRLELPKEKMRLLSTLQYKKRMSNDFIERTYKDELALIRQ